jgi:hypothetical protein
LPRPQINCIYRGYGENQDTVDVRKLTCLARFVEPDAFSRQGICAQSNIRERYRFLPSAASAIIPAAL